MTEEIYERFSKTVREHYDEQESFQITGMLFAAMSEVLSSHPKPLTEFEKEEQTKMWTEAFSICNTYADALQFIKTELTDDAKEFTDSIKQVGQAQKDELFSKFLILRR